MPLMLVLFFSTWFRSFTSFNTTLMGRPDPSFLGAPILSIYSGSDSTFRYSNIFRIVFLVSAASGTPRNTTFRARSSFASSCVNISSIFIFRFEISYASPSIFAFVLCWLLSRVSTTEFHLPNCECVKQLNISWNGVNLTQCNLQVYIGVRLNRTLSYKAHIGKTKKKVGTKQSLCLPDNRRAVASFTKRTR